MNQLVDLETLRSFIEDELEFDEKFIQKIVLTFESYLENLRAIGYSGTKENIEEIRLMAHKIKSSCSSFGANSLKSKLEELEQAAANNDGHLVKRLYEEVHPLSIKTFDSVGANVNLLLLRVTESA